MTEATAQGPTARSVLPGLGTAALLCLPAGLTILFGFSSGGYFPGATAVAGLVLALALTLRVTLARRPFAGVSAGVLVACTALALFAIWTLVSAGWSGAPGRALLEFNRVLAYLLALALLGSVAMTEARLEWALRAFAASVFVVCGAGLVSRVAPDVLTAATTVAPDRLSYPVSYWNTLGLLALVGIVTCLHLASGPRQPALIRGLAGAAVPLLAATLLLTLSRGAMAVAVVALLVYVVLARPWGILATALVVGPATGIALAATYAADLVLNGTPTAAAVAQGHRLAGTLLLCAVAAGVLRAALNVLDVRLEQRAERRRGAGRDDRRALIAATAGAAVALVVVFIAFGGPGLVDRQYDRFVAGSDLQPTDVRDRLTNPGNNGRLDNWRVALEGYRAAPWVGQGAGTYQVLWSRARSSKLTVVDGHSLYLEVTAELGLIGLGLLLVALGTLVVAIAVRSFGRARSLYAALLAATLAWAVRAGIDWDWEMPVVTAWVFGLGGLAVAARRSPARGRGPAPLTRVVAGIGCLLLALTPALVGLSQVRLTQSIAAFRAGDCAATAEAALASIRFVDARPQPFELLAYCDVRAGLPDLAVRTMGKALARDPDNWEYHYGLGIVRAAAGRDPRAQLRTALALNPGNALVVEASRALDSDDPEQWKRRAPQARLPVRF